MNGFNKGEQYDRIEGAWQVQTQWLEKLDPFLPEELQDLPDVILLGKHIRCHFKTTFVVLNAGYRWDGADGPTIDTIDCLRASAVHDALYLAMLKCPKPLAKKVRRVADDNFYRILAEDGMPLIRRIGWYYGVRWFGGLWAKGPW